MPARSLTIEITILVATLALLAGCQTPPEEPDQTPPPVPPPQRSDPQLTAARETIATLQAQITLLKQRQATAREQQLELQLQLLEKQSRIAQLQQAHSQAVQEVVRAKARLRSRHSKAETVANLAELKLSLKNAQKRGDDSTPSTALLRARQYLAMAEAELEANNFEGASYLIDQARRSLGRADSSDNNVSSQSSAFPVPLKMKVKGTANVRSGANRKQRVLFQLHDGAQVSAIDRKGLWVHIRTADKKKGWIHFGLLSHLSNS